MAGLRKQFSGERGALSPVAAVSGQMFNFRLSRPLRLLFGAQHHGWPRAFSLLRVRAPFAPISRFRSMGLDPMERDSNGDFQNDASTQESFRAQTAVLSP